MVAGQGQAVALSQPEVRQGPPLLLLLGLVGDSAIFDLHPGNSWAERLVDEGFDVFLFDWGKPEAAEGDHTLETYLHGYLVHAVDEVRRVAGADEISMGTYCMGSLMAPAAVGRHPSPRTQHRPVHTPLRLRAFADVPRRLP